MIIALVLAAGLTEAQPPVPGQPDSQKVRADLSQLMEHYPPSLKKVLEIDPVLLSNQAYLAPYPALVTFLNTHPEVIRNPSFYIGEPETPRPQGGAAFRMEKVFDMWQNVMAGLAVFLAFGLAISLLIWLIRTLIDYRRWNRLTKMQTDVHTKLLDRFTSNEDLLAYMQSPAGAKFLESTPIRLDAGSRSMGAPLSRILWSMQAGVVLLALGLGLISVAGRLQNDIFTPPLHPIGVLAVALGVGFLVSAILSYAISQRLGLLERQP